MAGEVVALWFSDIEGSTRLLLRLGDEYERVLDRHRQIVRHAFAAFRGDERGTEGDSFFAVFPTARVAAGAAIAVQSGLAAEPWPEGANVVIRIGLHLGEVQRHPGGDLTGLAIHMAARVMAAGHGGQIVVTRPFRDQLDDSVEVIDLGDHELKDMPQPVALYQLMAPGLGRRFPPLRTATRHRDIQLPRLTTSFVGRRQELERAEALLASGPVVSLVGHPGCGKTRLALEIALRASDGYELVSLVDLASVERPEEVGLAVALAAGVEASGGDPIEGTAAHFGERAALLVIDNCEHVLDAARGAVQALVDRCPSVRILATSQTPLGLEAESVVPIGGLERTADDDYAARQLFVDRAAARGVEIGTPRLAAVDELVAGLDFIPLAIELAASLAPTVSPEEMVGLLAHRFDLLVADGTASNIRHSTLRRAIAWGFDRLPAADQRLAARLAVCPGPFDMAAAEALSGATTSGLVIPALHRLVRSSWLLRTAGLVGSRYRMLGSLREFALTTADEAERLAAEDTHARHFLRLIGPGPLGEDAPREAAEFTMIDEDLPNILGALRWAITNRAHLDAAADTFLALLGYWQTRPSWREPSDLLDELLEVCRGSIDNGLEAELLTVKAFYEMMVAGADASATIDEAGDVAARSGSVRARLRWAYLATQVYGWRSDLHEARRYADILIEDATAAGSARFAQMGYFSRATGRQETEGLAASEADLRRGLAIAGDRALPTTLAFTHAQLALLAFRSGDGDAAKRHADESMIAAVRSDHRIAEHEARVTAARVTGDLSRRRAVYDEVIEDVKKLGTPGLLASLHIHAAAAALADGDVDAAVSHMATGDALGGTTDPGSADAWLVRAAVYRASGKCDEAIIGLRGALDHAYRHQIPGRAWSILWVLAGWGKASDDPVMNLRIRAAAEGALAVFGWPDDREMFGIDPMPDASALDPIDLDEAVTVRQGLR